MWCYRLLGIVCITIGIVMTSMQLLWTTVKEQALLSLHLVEGTEIYKAWTSPVHLTFSCYLFNVTNPDEVMRGDNPKLAEYGPFTYDEILERRVIDVDEEMDEITYTAKSTYRFNKHLSVAAPKREKVNILNPAYIGTISLLATLPPDFMKKYGNNIPKLFPNRKSIFLNVRPTDLLFDGVKVSCNAKKFPELGRICTTMKASPPPVFRESGREDVFLLSIFQNRNDTFTGPFSVNRGVKNITRLGDLTSFKGKRVQSLWTTEDCNTVRGTDTITWAPLIKPLRSVSTFVPELCRTVDAYYRDDISVHGLIGSRFVTTTETWSANKSHCYCLLENKVPNCLPEGLMDASECQKIPVVTSEPHFLHADPELLTYARGLNPDESLHNTYIVIEPFTGTPLTGQKRIQLNLKLTRQPVELLSNVSEGYFPILWCENGNTPTLSIIMSTYQALRLLHFAAFVDKVPLIVGIYIILMSMLYCDCTKCKVQPTVSFAESILISPNSHSNIPANNPRRILRAFE